MPLHQVDSTNIDTIEYSRRTRRLFVTFHSGYTYMYSGVPLNLVGAMFRARSKGRFFNKWIRDNYRYQRLN